MSCPKEWSVIHSADGWGGGGGGWEGGGGYPGALACARRYWLAGCRGGETFSEAKIFSRLPAPVASQTPSKEQRPKGASVEIRAPGKKKHIVVTSAPCRTVVRRVKVPQNKNCDEIELIGNIFFPFPKARELAPWKVKKVVWGAVVFRESVTVRRGLGIEPAEESFTVVSM